MAVKSKINVVVPVLNDAAALAELLPQLDGYKVFVVDGGSQDESVAIAERHQVQLLKSEAGRGRQLALGAGHTHAEWLLFLHADSRLGAGWEEELADFTTSYRQKLAVFRFALDDPRRRARFLEKCVAWRAHFLGLPYGDQGLLIHRNAYLAAGGFADLPIMEDVAFIRNFKRADICFLQTPLITRAARFQRRGFLFQIIRNNIFLLLYFLGVSPARLARFY